MNFIRENFGIIILSIAMFRHFLNFTQYKNNIELKRNFYISSILGLLLLGLVIIYRFTNIINSTTIITILLIGAVVLTYFQWPLLKRYNTETDNKEI